MSSLNIKTSLFTLSFLFCSVLTFGQNESVIIEGGLEVTGDLLGQSTWSTLVTNSELSVASQQSHPQFLITNNVLQSIIPAESGFVSTISIRLGSNTPPNDGIFYIREGSGEDGAILGQLVINGWSANSWNDIDFSSEEIYLFAGNSYTLQIDPVGNDHCRVGASTTDPYPDGSLISGAPDWDLAFIVNSIDLSPQPFLEPTDDGIAVKRIDSLLFSDGSIQVTSPLDDQEISLANDILSIENGGSITLEAYLDNTDDQQLSLAQDTLYLEDGNKIYLGNYLDNSDEQGISTFSISNDSLILGIENDATAVHKVDLGILSKTLLTDADGDTKIEVEQSNDEDQIRFTTASNDALIIDSEGNVGVGGFEPTERLSVYMGTDPTAVLSAASLLSNVYFANQVPASQTYTATVTGILDQIEMNFHDVNSGNRTVTIIDVDSGETLGSITFDVTTSSNQWITIDFSALAIEQVANKVYEINIDNRLNVRMRNGNPYPGGEVISFPDYDFAFKVYTKSYLPGFKVGDSGVSINDYTLPLLDGASGQILSTDGTGILSWIDEDNLGNHLATQNIQLNDKWLSNDGANEGIKVDGLGSVTIASNSSGDDLIIDGQQISKIKLQSGTVGAPAVRSLIEFESNDEGRAMGFITGNDDAGDRWFIGEPYSRQDYGQQNHYGFQIGYYNDATSLLSSYPDNSIIYLERSGHVGINNPNPNAHLDVIGDIEYTGTITDVSDRRLKENLVKVESVLPAILSLQAFTYNMKEDSTMTREYGLMAQDVQQYFPEMVKTIDNKDYLGLSYTQLIPVLIEGMKEQEERIRKLEEMNEKLLDTIKEIETQKETEE